MIIKLIEKFINSWTKETNIKARVAKWNVMRNKLITLKFRLAEAANILTEKTYNLALRTIRRRLARVSRLLELAEGN